MWVGVGLCLYVIVVGRLGLGGEKGRNRHTLKNFPPGLEILRNSFTISVRTVASP